MPVRQSGMVVFSRGWAEAVVGAFQILPGDPLLDSAVLHLMGAAGFQPTPDTLEADLTAIEANFSGYASSGPVPSGTVRLGTTQVGDVFPALFIGDSTDPFVPDTVTGWWLEAGGDWAAAGVLGLPLQVAIAAPGDWIYMSAIIPFPLSLQVAG